MKIRLHTLLAVLTAAPLLLAAAGCGSKPPSGSPETGAGAGTVATTPASSPVTLAETGSTLLYPLFNLWGPAFHERYPNVTITAQGTGSGAGIAQAAAGTVNIGASDAYLSEGDMAAHKGLMNIALAISAQQVNYNLPGVSEHLKLNGKVLAAMYQGTIKTWDDPQIAALNPGVNLPGTAVVPLHRSDGSGDTFLFTQYLSKQDPEGWGKSPGFGTTVDFPAVPGALGENGNGGMVTGCAETPGCVAYIGISFLDQASQRGLGEAQLGNSSGNFLLPDAQSIQAGGWLRIENPGEPGDFDDRRARPGRLPDHQLRVRHRQQPAKGRRHRADLAGISALGDHRRQQGLVPRPGSFPAAAARGGEVV